MSTQEDKPARRRAPIGGRPAADPASTWVRQADLQAAPSGRVSPYTARLTVDVTPELRARIKVTAFQRNTTAADMLRQLLEERFSPEPL